jgi:hypothetical protein
VFAWGNEWYGMSLDSIIKYEKETYTKTNEKVLNEIKTNNHF